MNSITAKTHDSNSYYKDQMTALTRSLGTYDSWLICGCAYLRLCIQLSLTACCVGSWWWQLRRGWTPGRRQLARCTGSRPGCCCCWFDRPRRCCQRACRPRPAAVLPPAGRDGSCRRRSCGSSRPCPGSSGRHRSAPAPCSCAAAQSCSRWNSCPSCSTGSSCRPRRGKLPPRSSSSGWPAPRSPVRRWPAPASRTPAAAPARRGHTWRHTPSRRSTHPSFRGLKYWGY